MGKMRENIYLELWIRDELIFVVASVLERDNRSCLAIPRYISNQTRQLEDDLKWFMTRGFSSINDLHERCSGCRHTSEKLSSGSR